MSQGRIEQVGLPREIYDQPSSPFVHEFIGNSSQVPVRVERDEIWFGARATGLRTTDAGGAGSATLP